MLGQKHHADAIVADLRQGNALRMAFLAHEGIGNLHQDAGTIAGEGVSTHSAAVGEVPQDTQTLLDDFVALPSLDVGHKAYATGVMLIGRVIQALSWRQGAVRH